MENILVTGGTAFTGSDPVDRLLAQGNNVVCMANFDSYYECSIVKNNFSEYRKKDNYRRVEEILRFTDNTMYHDEMPGDVKQTRTDTSEAKELVGYKSDVDLEQGARNFIEWNLKKEEIKAGVS